MKAFLYLVIAMGLMLDSCSNNSPISNKTNRKKSNDCLPDSLSALAMGKKLLIEKYGYSDSASRKFEAILSKDSIWHVIAEPNVFGKIPVSDTAHINLGNEIVAINKHNCDIIGFFIAR